LWYYSIGILGLRSNDIILTSFPKSGNTWIRFFLCNLISLEEWGGEPVTFPKLNATMPELGVNNLFKVWKCNAIPRVVKTHKPYWRIFKGHRVILLVRDPRDVMVSYYHFEKEKRDKSFVGSFSEFIRHPTFGVEAWCEHFASWRSEASVIVTYEDLQHDDVTEFSRMLQAVDVDVDERLIREAATRSRFESMRKAEEKEGVRRSGEFFEEEGEFMRRGERGQWQEYFNSEDMQYTRRIVGKHDIEEYNL